MYIIEGNMGAGKSTLLRLLGQHIPPIKTIGEPIENWQSNRYGQSLLTSFYKNPQRWAYTFETLTMAYRVTEHIKEQHNTCQTKIVERSIYSGYYCFAQNSYSQEFMTDLEWHIYKRWFNLLVPGKCHPPKGFIYMRISPDVSYERIKKRNRNAEQTMPLSYVEQIHRQHENFLIDKVNILPELIKVPVLVLDCNQEFETDREQFKKHVRTITIFINDTSVSTPPQHDSSPEKSKIFPGTP